MTSNVISFNFPGSFFWLENNFPISNYELVLVENFFNAERRGSRFAWFITMVVLAAVVGAGLAGYIFYKYRLRVCLKCSIHLIAHGL